MHPMQTMGEVATGPQHTAFGFSFGNGFFVWSGTDSIRSYPYVEHADFPTVVRTQLGPGQVGHSWLRRPDQSAQDIAIRGDTLIVLVRNWILDMYDLNTGDYLSTTVLPTPARGLAVFREAYLLIDARGLFPTVIALQERRQ